MDFCIALPIGNLLHTMLYFMQKAAILNTLKKTYFMVNSKGLGEFVIRTVTLIKKLKKRSGFIQRGYNRTVVQRAKSKAKDLGQQTLLQKGTARQASEGVFFLYKI